MNSVERSPRNECGFLACLTIIYNRVPRSTTWNKIIHVNMSRAHLPGLKQVQYHFKIIQRSRCFGANYLLTSSILQLTEVSNALESILEEHFSGIEDKECLEFFILQAYLRNENCFSTINLKSIRGMQFAEQCPCCRWNRRKLLVNTRRTFVVLSEPENIYCTLHLIFLSL